jgi:cytochrome c oxidase cbb3-type subunit I/II
MRTPVSTSPGSIMPAYPWLYDATLDTRHTEGKIITLRRIGVPYPDGYERDAVGDLRAQAERIAAGLQAAGQAAAADREIVALIAYLQRLGTDIKAAPVKPAPITTTSQATTPAGEPAGTSRTNGAGGH